MKAMLSLLFVCLFATQAVHSLYVELVGNVSADYHFDANSGDWGFRKTSFTVLDIGGIYGGAVFTSISTGGTKYSSAGDGIVGATTFVAGGFPTSFLAYFDSAVSANGSSSIINTDVSKAAGFIANSYVALVEKDANGAIVKSLPLKANLPILGGGLDWTVTASSTNETALLKSVTLGTSSSTVGSVSITFVVSDVIGVTNQGGAIVSPKSLESIIQIENFPYQNDANTLTLVVATATGDASESHDRRVLISGSAQKQVYTSVSGSAVINGANRDVSVSGYVNGDLYTNFDTTVQAQLLSLYQKNIASKIVNITFPAGASSILYDPSSGAGAPVEVPSQAGSAALVAINVMLVVIVAFVSVM